MSSLDNSCPIKKKKEGITQWNSNAKILNMLRRTVIIKLQKNFKLLLNGLESGDKTNRKYLNQKLNQRIKDWKVVGENH